MSNTANTLTYVVHFQPGARPVPGFAGGSDTVSRAVTVPRPDDWCRADRETRRAAERAVLESETVQRAMAYGWSISRFDRPPCECTAPTRGASGTCGTCGGTGRCTSVPVETPAPVLVAETPHVQPMCWGTERALVRQQLDEGLRLLGMEHVTLRVEWNGRFTARMGDARVTSHVRAEGRVRFSTPLWPRATADERRQTVLHELAHVVADLRHGRRCKHGPLWQRVMRELGLTPERCHNVDRTGLRRRRRRR